MNSQVIIPAEPSSLALMVSGIVSIVFFMLVTGQWKHIVLANREPKELGLIKASQYAFCEYEQRFVASLNRLTEYGFGERSLIVPPKTATS